MYGYLPTRNLKPVSVLNTPNSPISIATIKRHSLAPSVRCVVRDRQAYGSGWELYLRGATCRLKMVGRAGFALH